MYVGQRTDETVQVVHCFEVEEGFRRSKDLVAVGAIDGSKKSHVACCQNGAGSMLTTESLILVHEENRPGKVPGSEI